MNEPYLSFLLEGRKTVESRFSRRRVAPFGEVRAGDVLLLKSQSGPVVAVAEAAHAESFRLDPSTWKMIRGRFAEAICAQGQEFWDERSGARYATLIRVGQVEEISPLFVEKRDRRPWVVLGRRPSSYADRDQLELIAGVRDGGRQAESATSAEVESPVPHGDQLALLV